MLQFLKYDLEILLVLKYETLECCFSENVQLYFIVTCLYISSIQNYERYQHHRVVAQYFENTTCQNLC